MTHQQAARVYILTEERSATPRVLSLQYAASVARVRCFE